MTVSWLHEVEPPHVRREAAAHRLREDALRREAVRKRRWRRVKLAARIAAVPFVLPYALARLGWEWATH